MWVNTTSLEYTTKQISYTFFSLPFLLKQKLGKARGVIPACYLCADVSCGHHQKNFFLTIFCSGPLSYQTHNNHHSRTKIDAQCSPLVPNEEEKPQRNDGGTHTYILHLSCTLWVHADVPCLFSHLVLNISTWLAFTIIIIINSVLSLAMSLSLSSSSFQQ